MVFYLLLCEPFPHPESSPDFNRVELVYKLRYRGLVSVGLSEMILEHPAFEDFSNCVISLFRHRIKKLKNKYPYNSTSRLPL